MPSDRPRESVMFSVCSRTSVQLRARPAEGRPSIGWDTEDYFMVTTPVLCSVTEAAHCLGIGKTKAYELIADGSLDTVSIGSRRLVKVASIHRLVESFSMGRAA